MALDTSRFLDQVKMKTAVPVGRFLDQEILDMAYDCLLADVQPFLISLREDYYVVDSSSVITAGTDAYPINSRALGLVLRSVRTLKDGVLTDVPRIDASNLLAQGFYFKGNNVILNPSPVVDSTLIQSYFQRINRPVLKSACARVTAIDTITGVVTTSVPTGWDTSGTYDLINGTNGNDLLATDLVANAIGSTSITFSPAQLPPSLSVGCYVAVAGETPFIQVPDDAIPLVQQLVASDILESLGDQGGMQIASAKAEKLRAGLARIMVDRIQGNDVKFIPQI